ncbi:BRCA1-associated RING domain protein 1 [Telopea speciosissima]|uniref:BRCA1-associated RING domain protein 1 n=1 Tax=Telopea speciosissima TaxID=54955 RepID=UPI001CC48100|nr:BRCA1-associated RING domain protein 1 [Telopea speciosissima]
MAVPGRRNGMEDDENEEEGLFEEDGLVELDSDTLPHLQPIAEAAQLGDVDALRHALDNLSGSIDEPVEDGDSALHLACLYGHLPCVQLLLERGANMETKDEDGAIPLHDACAGGYTEIVRLLINFANNTDYAKRMLDTVDVEGDTPLHHAARGEHVDVIQLLLNSGASPTKANIYGKIPSELSDLETQARRILEAAAN